MEVSIDAGQPYSSFLKKSKSIKRNFKVVQIAFQFEMDDLYARINHRCDKMIEKGLLKEVESLLSFKDLSPLRTIGYQEFFDYLDGKTDLEGAIQKFKQHSRNYAKKQMTWLRRDKNIHWFKPENEMSIFHFINETFNN